MEDTTSEETFEDAEEVTYGFLDCIYDDEPLGFENGWSDEVGKLEAQDSLDEIYLAKEGEKPRLVFVSSLLEPNMNEVVIKVLKEYKVCFT